VAKGGDRVAREVIGWQGEVEGGKGLRSGGKGEVEGGKGRLQVEKISGR
jgi:hypothetical protein